MRYTRQRLSKIADEGRRLFGWEGAIQKSAAFLNLTALLGILYLVTPVFGKPSIQSKTSDIVILLVLMCLLAINYLQFIVMIRLRRKWMELEKQSTYDGLTQVFNRACFEEILQDELRRAGRYHYPLTLALIDLDNFKSFNDTYGHTRGDELLQRFSKIIQTAIRTADCLARYGGDEFCILLPHTDLVKAEKFLSRILLQVNEMLDATFSAGVTSYRAGENKTQFLMRADLALYQAKREGKNRIRCMIGRDDSHAVLSF
ncbi:MAG: GGDEF domain-containing protein [Candidatus Omnitrophica bacterium]|nr:GGDEF domain-containing protein [Candidatus Omnitrophota bacterium]